MREKKRVAEKQFARGRRVRVSFEGNIHFYDPTYVSQRVSIAPDSPDGRKVDITWVEKEFITFPVPEDWPPRLGDIWEAEGQEYIVETYLLRDDPIIVVQPIDQTGRGCAARFAYSDSSVSKNLSSFADLDPVLVRRRKG